MGRPRFYRGFLIRTRNGCHLPAYGVGCIQQRGTAGKTTSNQMAFTSLSVRLSEADLDILKRIAKAENRRLSDLVQLIFGCGVDVMFCEQHVIIDRKDSEIPADELKQIELNEKLMKEDGFWQLKDEERQAKGYRKGFCRHISNHDLIDDKQREDRLIEPLADRIRALAMEDLSA